MTAGSALLFLAGLVVLVAGAELLVRGASRLAVAFGVAPLVVGLTVVAYGTSAPELAVSVESSLAGQADLALGNVVGSNILNVLFILGVSAAITPLVVAQQLIRRDVPLVIAASVLVLLFALDGRIGRFDGLILVAGAVAYTVYVVRASRREGQAGRSAYEKAYGPTQRRRAPHWGVNVGLVVVGLALLVLGAHWMVDGAVVAARALGVSELVVGLTIIAFGTSLPEVATSVIASVRGERDIAVGNVIGSNLFNLVLVLGLTAAVSPHGVPVAPAALRFDIPVMIAVSVACLPIFFTGSAISRWEGLLFLAYYVAYTSYLVLDAEHSVALRSFEVVMLGFVVPLTAVTLGVVAAREWRSRARRRA